MARIELLLAPLAHPAPPVLSVGLQGLGFVNFEAAGSGKDARPLMVSLPIMQYADLATWEAVPLAISTGYILETYSPLVPDNPALLPMLKVYLHVARGGVACT